MQISDPQIQSSKKRSYRRRVKASIVGFVHQGMIKVICCSLALQSEMMKVLEHCEREGHARVIEACREQQRAKELVCEEITARWLVALAI